MPKAIGSSETRLARHRKPCANSFKKTAFWEVTMDFIRELWLFMKVRKKFWLLPIIVMMAVFGGLVVLSQGSAVAPFIYIIF
jgi:hypothetical protein